MVPFASNSVKFPLDKLILADLVKRIVKFRIRENLRKNVDKRVPFVMG